MSTVPTQPDQAVSWCLEHVEPWTEHALTLKLDPAAVAEFDTLTDAAQAARQALVSARLAYKNALADSRTAVKAMRTSAGANVTTIRATAKNSATPQAIYSLALVPAPADPAPRPAPGKPAEFRADLLEGGGIRMRFKCPNPPRTGPVTYRVERRIGTQAPLVFFMNAKERTFDDETIPAGTAEATYAVTAQTSTRDGNTGYFSVRFGANNQATVVELPSGEAAEKKAG